MTLPLFGQLAGISFAIPVISGLVKIKFQDKEWKLYFSFFFITMVEVLLEILLSRNGINNQRLINVFRIIEVGSFILIYQMWIQHSLLKTLSWLLFAIFIPYSILTNIVLTTVDQINNYDAVFSSIIYLLLSGLLLYRLVHENGYKQVTSHKVIFCITILIYNAGTILLFSCSNIILKMGMEYFAFAWKMNWVLCIVCNVLYGYSFFVYKNE